MWLVAAMGFALWGSPWSVHGGDTSKAEGPDVLSAPRRVYVPMEDLDVVLNRDKRGVLLSNAQFLELSQRAKQNAQEAARLPAKIVLTGAQYDARPTGERLLVTARITFMQFEEGWQMLPLSFQGLSVEKATIDGEPARLGRAGENGQTVLQLFHDRVGKGVLVLEFSAPLAAVGGDKVAVFRPLPRAVQRLRMTVPAGKHLVARGLSVERPAASDQEAVYEIDFNGGSEIRLQITDRPTTLQGADALLFATTAIGLGVAPGEVTWRAATSLDVFGDPINTLIFSVPKSVQITAVESTGLESWRLAEDEKTPARTTVVLDYRQPFGGSRRVSFDGLLTTRADESWQVPALTLSKVTSHVGRVIVQYPAGVRVRLAEAKGVRQSVWKDGVLASLGVNRPKTAAKVELSRLLFDVWQEDFRLRFTTQAKQREVQTAISTVVDVNAGGLDLQTVATVESYSAPLFALDVALPAEWTIVAVKVAEQPILWQTLPQQAGTHQIRIPLEPPLPAGTEVKMELSAHRDLEKWPIEFDPVTFELPQVRLPQSAVVEGTYVIRADDDLEVVPVEISGLDPANINVDGQRLGYTYQDSVFTGQLQVGRKPARVSARTLTVARLERETRHAHLETRLHVEGSSVRAVRLGLSESAGNDVRFHLLPGRESRQAMPRIVEQHAADPQKGERIWTLVFDQRVRGEVVLAVDVTVPRGSGEEFQTPVLRVVDAVRENGFVAVEGAGDQRLKIEAVDASGTPLREVDPVDLPVTRYVPKQRIVAAYQYVRPGHRVTLAEERFDRQPLPTAICHQSRLESMLGQTGEFQHRATFTFAAVGVQNLSLQLPESGELWAALVDGQPVEVRSTGTAHLVPLPAADRPDASRSLQVYYRTRVEPVTTFGKLRQQPPRLTAVDGKGKQQSLETLEQIWMVHYPQETLLTSSDGPFVPTTELDSTSLLGRLQQSLTVVSPKELLDDAIWVAVATGIIVLLSLAYRRFRKLRFAASVLLMGVFGIVVVALLLSDGCSVRTHSDVALILNDLEESQLADDSSGPVNADAPFFMKDEVAFDRDQDKTATMTGAVERSVMLGTTTQPMPAEVAAGLAPPQAPATPQPTSQPAPPVTAGDPFGATDARAERHRRVTVQRGSEAAGSVRGRTSDRMGRAVAFGDNMNGQVGGGMGGGGGAFGGMGGMGAQANAPADAPAVGQKPVPSTRRGLLSLALEFTPPAGSSQKEFRYAGTQASGRAIGLELGYENHTAGRVRCVFLAVTITLFLWWFRRRSITFRGLLGALGVCVPLALMSVAPTAWHTVLDGVFFGALGGVVLWFWCAAATFLSRSGAWKTRAFWRRPLGKTATLLLAAALGLTSITAAGAQKQSTPKPPQNQPAAPAAPSTFDSQTFPIVVPYDSGSDPLAAERVFLPHAKFVELWNLANPDKRIKHPAPVDGLVAEALYVAELKPSTKAGSGHVTVSGRIVLFSFRSRQITLEVPLGRVALTSALLDGKTAPVVLQSEPVVPEPLKQGRSQAAVDSRLAVVVEQPGLHVLDLQFELPLRQTGPAGQFTVPLRPVAAGRLAFTLPNKDLEVRVDGSSSAYRVRSSNETQVIEVPIDRGGDVTVAWQPKQTDGAVDGIVHVQSSTAVVVEDGGVRLSSGHQFQVPQGILSDVTFTLPKTLRVQSIAGPDVSGWQLDQADDDRTVRVFFRRKINDTTSVTFELFADTPLGTDAATLQFPNFGPVGVTRDVGTVGIFSGDQFVLRTGEVKGLTQIDAGAFKPKVTLTRPKTAPQFAYRYTARPLQLPLVIERRQPRSAATAQHAAVVGRRKLRLASRWRLDLTDAPVASVSLRLPAGFLAVDVNATGLSDWYVTPMEDGDQRVLTVEFDTPRTGRVDVALEGTVAKQPEDVFVQLTVPALMNANRLRSEAAVWLDQAYSGSLSAYTGWRSVDPSQLSGELRSRQSRPAQFAFASAELAPKSIDVTVSRATPRLVADSVAFVTLTDVLLDYTLAMNWRITQAAADSFTFTTPKWLAGQLDFTGSGIRQVQQTSVDDDRTRWTITLQDPVQDGYFLLARATLPPPTADRITPPSVAFLQDQGPDSKPRFARLETQQQYIVVINQSNSQLSALDPAAVESVTRDELPIQVNQGLVDQALELVRVRRPAAAPAWSIQRFEQQQGAPASVNVADLITAIAADGSWRTAATYTIKNRSRQFLALDLPAGAAILSVFVQDRPSRSVTTEREGKPIHLIALPKTSEADLSFQVRVVVSGTLKEGPLPRGFQPLGKEMDLPAPRVLSQSEDGEYGIPVAKTLWTVYLPKDLDTRVIDDPDRTNLGRLASEERELTYAVNQVREATELLSGVLEGSYSGKQKYRAWRNVKQLGDSIRSQQQEVANLSREVSGKQVQEFQQLTEQFEKKLAESTQRVQVDDSNRSAVIITDGGINLQGLDEQQQWAIIAGNNNAIVASNAPRGLAVTESRPQDNDADGERFGFEVLQAPEKPAAKTAGIKKGEAVDKLSLSRRRAVRKKQSLDQLRSLNTIIVEQKNEQQKERGQAAEEAMSQQAELHDRQPAPAGLGQPGQVDGESVRTTETAGFGERPGAGYENGATVPGATQAGGLSLAIDIPVPPDAQKLTFSKVSGTPRLALAVWPRRSLEVGFGLVWSVVWIVLGLTITVACGRPNAGVAIRRSVPKALIALGLLGFFLFPAPVAGFGFTLFVLGALAVGFRRRPA